MPQLILSTEGAYIGPFISGAPPETQELMCIFNRTLDPCITMAPRLVIILTSQYNINDWAISEHKVVQVACAHVQTLVNNGTVSLQMVGSATAMTDTVVLVENPHPFMNRFMTAGFTSKIADSFVKTLTKHKLDKYTEGDWVTPQPDLVFTTDDVNLGS